MTFLETQTCIEQAIPHVCLPSDDVFTRVETLFNSTDQQKITLNHEQITAICEAALVIESGETALYTVHGLAGTGKTVVLSFLARMYPQAYVVAPTGKAALIIFKKNAEPGGHNP